MVAPLHGAVLFEKLIEQHRVHCFVAHGVNLALRVFDDQIGIDLFNVLSHQAKLRYGRWVKFLLYDAP